ncbi:MAG: hypothetical protein AAGF84_07070 [Planctomycetota bacterium]
MRTAYLSGVSGSLTASAVCLAFVSPAAANGTWTPVAERGDAVPGIPGAFFTDSRPFYDAIINDAGMVGFEANYRLPGNQGGRGLQLWDPTGSSPTLDTVFQAGVTRDQNGEILGGSIMLTMNGRGDFAFSTFGGVGDTSYERVATVDRFGNARTIATSGDPAPNVPDEVLWVQNDPWLWLNDAGGLVFPSYIGNDFMSRDTTLLRASPNSGLTARLGTGTANPNLRPAPTFDASVRGNARGDLAVFVEGLPGDATGIVSLPIQATSPNVLVRDGDPTPGLPNRTFDLNVFQWPADGLSIGDGGHIAFAAVATDGNPNRDQWGVWRMENGSPSLLATDRAWDDVLGVANNAHGQTAFAVGRSSDAFQSYGPRDSGATQTIFVADADGSVREIFKTGSPLPGTRFSEDAYPTDGSGDTMLALNDRGDVLFRVQVGASSGFFGNDALVLYNAGRNAIELVAGEGESVLLADGSEGVVDLFTTFFPAEEEDAAQGKILNAAGQVALRLRFTNGRDGIYRYEPKPATPVGDFNGDGRVEQGDLNLVLTNWGQDGSTPPEGWDAHNIGLGTIDQAELNAVLSHWGGTLAPDLRGLVVVPEPAAMAGLVGLLVLLRQRKKPTD